MSLDVFIQVFDKGEPGAVPTNEILRVIAPVAGEREDSFVDLMFGGDSCTLYFDTTAPTTQAMTLNRPCGDPRLADLLFEIMTLGNCILFAPGEDLSIVASAATREELPDEVVEAVGEPVVANTPEAFRQAFFPPE